MKVRYKKLSKRRKYLQENSTIDDTPMLMEVDCIDHIFALNKLEQYTEVLKFAKSKGFKRVFDIGCAYGHQSEAFIDSDIEYIGIDDGVPGEYWNLDKYIYISEHYPFKINATETDLAVSILCLTWNCYLYEGEKTLKEQCEALKRDFKHVLLYMPKDKVGFVKEYFKGYEQVNEFMYFYN